MEERFTTRPETLDVFEWNFWFFVFYHQAVASADSIVTSKPVGAIHGRFSRTDRFTPDEWEFKRVKRHPVAAFGVHNPDDQKGKYPIFSTTKLTPKSWIKKAITFNF